LLTILSNIVWPGYLDRYLARKAFDGQQAEERIARDRRDNLDRPLTRLHRTRGSFSGEAATGGPLLPAEVVRIDATATGALLFFALGLGIAWWRRHR
jgi:hypothetical protein